MRNPRSATVPLHRRSMRCRNSKFNATSSSRVWQLAGNYVDVASRGEHDRFHDTAFEFLRNDAMDARNFFSPGVEPFKRDQFGAADNGFRQSATRYSFMPTMRITVNVW